MKHTVESKQAALSEAISRQAYAIWESKGRPQGRDLECWLEAESQINGQRGSGTKSERRQHAGR